MKNKNLLFGLLILGIIGIGFMGGVGGVEDELTQLEQELIDAGFDWLVDYDASYPSVEVYEKDFDIKIADFGKISEDKKYQIFLSNLNGSQDIFDLRVVGGEEMKNG